MTDEVIHQIDRHHVLAVSDQVISQNINGETVLMDLKSEAYFGLNQTGTRIWELLGQGRSVTEIMDQLHTEFDVPDEELDRDCLDLLNDLAMAGLVVATPGPISTP